MYLNKSLYIFYACMYDRNINTATLNNNINISSLAGLTFSLIFKGYDSQKGTGMFNVMICSLLIKIMFEIIGYIK